MDAHSLNVILNNRGSFCPQICSFPHRNSWIDRQLISSIGKWGSFRVEDKNVSETGASKLKLCCTNRGLVVRAMGKKNNPSGSSDKSVPEEGGSTEGNPASNSTELDMTDWRNFRANLISRGQVQLTDADAPFQDGISLETSKPLGAKWAHSISAPETGCVLVATEKLDGVRTFQRTVVLLLRCGNKGPSEGPFGVIINRPLHKKIKHMKPTNLDLSTTFAECSLYFGGPLEASMFLLNTGDKLQLPGFEQVIPGMSFGARNSLDEAAVLVKKKVLRTQDFRFFHGYAGWELDQLKEEIDLDYWHVAACSTNLINEAAQNPSFGLWEEILQLMGGSYSELSRKPKEDN